MYFVFINSTVLHVVQCMTNNNVHRNLYYS